jgi:hypothetical protein
MAEHVKEVNEAGKKCLEDLRDGIEDEIEEGLRGQVGENISNGDYKNGDMGDIPNVPVMPAPTKNF